MKSRTWEIVNATAEENKNYLGSVCGADGGLRFTTGLSGGGGGGTTLGSGSHYARLEKEEGMQACHLVMSMLFTLIKMWGYFFSIILNYFVLKRFE